jgi:hypothetical protein
MRVTIEASSQAEFDAKRDELATLVKSSEALKPRRSPLPVQNQILDHWDSKFQKMLEDLKEEIGQILEYK